MYQNLLYRLGFHRSASFLLVRDFSSSTERAHEFSSRGMAHLVSKVCFVNFLSIVGLGSRSCRWACIFVVCIRFKGHFFAAVITSEDPFDVLLLVWVIVVFQGIHFAAVYEIR